MIYFSSHNRIENNLNAKALDHNMRPKEPTRVSQTTLKQSLPQDMDKHPETKASSLNLFFTIQKHLNKQFLSYYIALVSSLSHTLFPQSTCKANCRANFRSSGKGW